MARPSKLTQKQWDIVERRLLEGEKPAALAKEFDIDRAAISRRFSQQTKTVKSVANQMLAAEDALRALPVAQQLNAINLVDQLRSISGHLAGAANYGAATAHRLAGIASGRAALVDYDAPLGDEGINELKGIAMLQRVANEAGEIGVKLLNANREAMAQMNSGAAAGHEAALDDLE